MSEFPLNGCSIDKFISYANDLDFIIKNKKSGEYEVSILVSEYLEKSTEEKIIGYVFPGNGSFIPSNSIMSKGPAFKIFDYDSLDNYSKNKVFNLIKKIKN